MKDESVEQLECRWTLSGAGTGVFVEDALISGILPVSVAFGDLDADGDLDALVGNALFADQILLNDGQGLFSNGQVFENANTQSVALGDLDGDGDWDRDGVFDQLDIVTALQTGNYLQGPYAVDALG